MVHQKRGGTLRGLWIKIEREECRFLNPPQASLKKNIGYCSSHFYQIKYRTPKLVLPLKFQVSQNKIPADPLAWGAGAITFAVVMPPVAVVVPPDAPPVPVVVPTVAARRHRRAASSCCPSPSSYRLSPCCPLPLPCCLLPLSCRLLPLS